MFISAAINKSPQYAIRFHYRWKKKLSKCSMNLERRVKHHQLGARGHDVVALVGFHKSHVNITLGFCTCREEKSRKNTFRARWNLTGEQMMETKHTQSLNNHYGSGPLTATSLLHILIIKQQSAHKRWKNTQGWPIHVLHKSKWCLQI